MVKLSYAIKNKVKIGQYIDYSDSNFYTKDKKFQYKNLAPLLANFYANVAHRFFYALAFKYAKLGGLNQGVIPILTCVSSILNSISFYLAFGEILSGIKIVGMVFACCSVVFLGIYSSNQNDLNEAQEVKISENLGEEINSMTKSSYAFLSLGLALIVPLGFAFKHFLIRKYKGSYQYWMLPIDAGILEYLFFSCWSIYYQVNTGFTSK